MFHTIEFRVEYAGDREISPKQPLERLRLRRGTRVRTQLKPYVVEALTGPVEVADLFLEDGTTLRCVPFGSFVFLDEQSKAR